MTPTITAFGDFSYYLIGDRAGISMVRDPYTHSRSGLIDFTASLRTDGKLSLATAVQHLIMHS